MCHLSGTQMGAPIEDGDDGAVRKLQSQTGTLHVGLTQ